MLRSLLGFSFAGAALLVAASAPADNIPPDAPVLGQHPADAPGPLLAAENPPVPVGLHSGDTVPNGHSLLYGEVGWPDLSIGIARGVGDRVDVGGRFSLIYGVNYLIPKDRNGVTDISVGFGATVPIRVTLLRNGRTSLLVHADPGIRFDYLDAMPRRSPPFFGPQIPLGLDFGIHASPKTTVTLGIDVPIQFRVTPDPTGLIAVLAGVTLERRVTDRFGLSFNVRPGVLYGVNRTGSSTDLALLSQMGFFGWL